MSKNSHAPATVSAAMPNLRRHGLRLAQRGGKNAKKRAAVAVARKLAVLLHHLWRTGATYEADQLATQRAARAA